MTRREGLSVPLAELALDMGGAEAARQRKKLVGAAREAGQVLLENREEGWNRRRSLVSHHRSEVLARLLERHPQDCRPASGA
jgi:hypothetical protein